ncbi:MAG: DedA family protein [Alphaproteobacteria bacterium]|nr:DedA family protein [Alphaproteobacteria bacterium]
MLEKFYDWMMKQAESKHALRVLMFMSFIESSFFPFPPDPVLAVVVAKNRNRAMYYAIMCTLASVFGGFLGYFIGYACFQTLGVYILDWFNITPDKFNEIVLNMGRDTWAFWLICAKGLTPIPFKIVTIASGFARVNLWIFFSASVITRTMRFIILSWICQKYGNYVLEFIEAHKKVALFVVIGIVVVGFLLLKIFV